MAKKSGTSPPEPPPMLTRKVEDVRTVLAERLRLGTELLDRKVSHGGEMMVVVGECRKWSDYNVRLLEQLFTTEKIAREYEWSRPAPTMSFGEPTHTDEFNRVRECIASEVAFLDSLVHRIDLYAAQPTAASRAPTAVPRASNPTRVFIVHGQKEGPRESVARFLERFHIEPVILHEQASRSSTLIEKLERHSDVHFAVVLLTGDDEGRLKGDASPPRARARQNVILELGYFVGLLGRPQVCALYEEGVELPSDWDGVVWVALDARGAWKLQLAKELKSAGFTIDMNAL